MVRYICDTDRLHDSTAFRSLVWAVRSVEDKLIMKLNEYPVIRDCFIEFTVYQNYALSGAHRKNWVQAIRFMQL